MSQEERVDKMFPVGISSRERAAFELGIKLGTVFHISMGIPVSKDKDVIQSLEKGLEKSISCQPYVTDVKVKIHDVKVKGQKKEEFDYSTINPQCLSAHVNLKYKDIMIEGKLEWDEDLQYPIMFISKIG